MSLRGRLKVSIGLPSYWQAYGGISTLLKSKFFYISVILTWVCYPVWSKPEWWGQVVSVLPTILGFTIAAFSIFLSLGNRIYKGAMHKRKASGRVSLYLKICAIFAHQMFVQAGAVLLAIVLPALYQRQIPVSEPWVTLNEWARVGSWAFAYFLFIYGILLVVAGGLNIFSIATLIQAAEEVDADTQARMAANRRRSWLVKAKGGLQKSP